MTASTALTQQPSWQRLHAHFNTMQTFDMRDAFATDKHRFDTFHVKAAGITLDYAKNRITSETMTTLLALADACQLPHKINAMFEGHIINTSEQRPVLHTALRNVSVRPVMVDNQDVMPTINATLERMAAFCQSVYSHTWRGYTGKAITDVVSIGIGGSFLGPKLVANALTPYANESLKVHYLANIDGTHITDVLKPLNPETTLCIVQSKSFGTQETLNNALAARRWVLDHGADTSDLAKHFVAVSSNVAKATEFGILEENIFPMWDWVGGRYSLWSAIGLPLALAFGMDTFRALLEGAHEMDEHFRTAPLEQNMPVIMALLGIWYVNFFGVHSHVILPYDHYLRTLPAHLQQLDMESNGKSVGLDNTPLDYHTGPVIWGGVGTNGQHAFHQLLHQGTHFSPCDFIIPMSSHNPVDNFHAMLVSNGLSQSQALLQGKSLQQARDELLNSGMSAEQAEQLAPQKVIAGNRPSNTLFFDRATPHIVGALIALYEHKVAAQGFIWGINSFDQWGVELGKVLGNHVLSELEAEQPELAQFDASTAALIQAFRRTQGNT